MASSRLPKFSNISTPSLYLLFTVAGLSAMILLLILLYEFPCNKAFAKNTGPPRSMSVKYLRRQCLLALANVFPSAVAHAPRTQPLPKMSIHRPPEDDPTPDVHKAQLDIPLNLSTCHPLPLWIPIARVGLLPASVCGRKGSTVAIWPEEPSNDVVRLLGCQPDGPSALLSGVGDQFAAGLGRRPSWLVWNDAVLEHTGSGGTHHCA